MPAAPVVVALLRAVNVGNRQLSMADLRRWTEEAGHRDVRTYVQSGNVVFRSALPFDEVAADLAERLAAGCGFEVPVVVRALDAWSEVLARCPYDTSVDPTRLAVGFATGPLAPEDLGRLDPGSFAPEGIVVDGAEVYLWLPDGQGRSRLAQAFGRTPAGAVTTVRNWRTVVRLEALGQEVAAG